MTLDSLPRPALLAGLLLASASLPAQAPQADPATQGAPLQAPPPDAQKRDEDGKEKPANRPEASTGITVTATRNLIDEFDAELASHSAAVRAIWISVAACAVPARMPAQSILIFRACFWHCGPNWLKAIPNGTLSVQAPAKNYSTRCGPG